MREKEAAEYLSVTPRTVRNYRRRGLLPSQEVKGRTCPVIEYDQVDLERLKAKLHRPNDLGKAEVRRPPRVSFGLSPEDFAELSAEAKQQGQTVGEYARRLMREAMESRLLLDIRDLRTQDSKNAAETKRLRSEVALAFEALLEFVGLSPGEAKDWVTQNLR